MFARQIPVFGPQLEKVNFCPFSIQEFHFCPLSGLEKDAQRLSGKVE
jgi:hypothetical protein